MPPFQVNREAIDNFMLPARAFAKWWLEAIRNFIVLGALGLIATKSGSTVLTFVFQASVVFFFLYCTSYISSAFYKYTPFRSLILYWAGAVVFILATTAGSLFASKYYVELLVRVIDVQGNIMR